MHIYTHKHHIIPKHIGGTDDPSNLVELTIEDHAIAHRHLWKMYGRWEDRLAWLGLSGMIDKKEIIWLANSEAHKGITASTETRRKMSKAHSGEKNAMHGKRHSPEAKQKMSERKKGKPLSHAHRQKMSESKKGKKHWNHGKRTSEETRRKISETLKNRHFRQTNDADV